MNECIYIPHLLPYNTLSNTWILCDYDENKHFLSTYEHLYYTHTYVHYLLTSSCVCMWCVRMCVCVDALDKYALFYMLSYNVYILSITLILASTSRKFLNESEFYALHQALYHLIFTYLRESCRPHDLMLFHNCLCLFKCLFYGTSNTHRARSSGCNNSSTSCSVSRQKGTIRLRLTTLPLLCTFRIMI
jgi:hypothetical protein